MSSDADTAPPAVQDSRASPKRDRDDTQSTASPPAPDAAASLVARLEEKMWRVFRRTCETQRWRRGCACATSTVTQNNEDEEEAEDLVVVDPTRWNTYWEAYSNAYGDCIDGLGHVLQQDGGSYAMHDGANYRRVLVRVTRAAAATITGSSGGRRTPSSSESGSSNNTNSVAGQQTEDNKVNEEGVHKALVDAARRFGALEQVKCERGIHSVQFTTLPAAALFQRWVRHITVQDLLQRTRVGSSTNGMDESETATALYRLAAKLAPADPRCVTAQLRLGPRLRLSTPYAQSLFGGMFDAAEVCYEPMRETFLVRFGSVEASKVALHALQHSLWLVFHLTLGFA